VLHGFQLVMVSGTDAPRQAMRRLLNYNVEYVSECQHKAQEHAPIHDRTEAGKRQPRVNGDGWEVHQIQRVAPRAGRNQRGHGRSAQAMRHFLSNPEKSQNPKPEHRLRKEDSEFEIEHQAYPTRHPHHPSPSPNLP